MNNETNGNVEQKTETLEPVIAPTEMPETTNANAFSSQASVEAQVSTAAEQIVAQVEKDAAKATEAYNKREAPVAPQQDRVQLIDTKPKLHAVKLGGVEYSTDNPGDKFEKTEVLDVVEEPKVVTDQSSTDNNAKSSKGTTFGLVLLFGGLLVMIIFLPDIREYFATMEQLKKNPVEEKIISGTLECTLDDSSDTLDYTYTYSFSFTDSKLYRLKNVSEIRGDVSLDEEELDKLKGQCDLLNTVVTDLSGISVSCKLENGLLTKTQSFNFSSIVVDDAITAYIEAGGSYPFYRYGDNIDSIEKELIGANYNCKRIK